MAIQQATPTSLDTSNLADLLERILDKGMVIAGDIRINLVNVELLTIQLRLVICSVDKAREMGMDWWVNNPLFMRQDDRRLPAAGALDRIVDRLEKLEAATAPESDAAEAEGAEGASE